MSAFDRQLLGNNVQWVGGFGAPNDDDINSASRMLQHGQDRMQRKTSDLIDAALEENSRRRSRELSASLDGAQGQQRHQQRPGIRRRGSMELELPFPASGPMRGPSKTVHRVDEDTVVVNVGHLHRRDVDPVLRRMLLDQALETQEQDNTELLTKLRQRFDRAGVEVSKVEVRFNNLNITADVRVGSKGMPTVANAFINTPLDLLTKARILPSTRHRHTILRGVSGVLKPGRLTLLLGPPGSGKTVLLKALAGNLHHQAAHLHVHGDITYNGETFDSFHVARTCAYVSQVDVHSAELTVRETLDFAARCLGPGHKQAYADELRTREKQKGIEPDTDIDALLKAAAQHGKRQNIVTDLILRILGLEVCADTLVGNQLMRGVSGGQRKRVTTGELLVGPAKTLFMDEISTGLDSSTTYLIVRCLRNYVHLLEGTMMISLLQPPPEVFDLFDDVLLLSEGQVAYFGPREDVTDFFAGLGFSIPERKGVADFLQEVTSRKDQQQYWSGDAPYKFVPVTHFHEAFIISTQGRAQAAKLEAPTLKQPEYLDPLVRERYALTGSEAFKACLRREWTLMKRNSFLYIFKTCQIVVLAIIAGTLFLRGTFDTSTIRGGSLYLGLLFFSIVHLMFSSYAEQTLMIHSLQVFFKQRNMQFFPAWAFAGPTSLLRMPYSLLDAIIWAGVVYWLVGLAPDAGRFFLFLVYLFLIHQMGTSLFRLMGALGREISRTNVFGSFALVLVILLGGFALKYDDIHPWWIWMFWVSPIMYAMNGLSNNEMSAPRWSMPLTIEGTTRTMGEWILVNNGLFTASYWRWMPVLALIGYWAVFTGLTFIALQYFPAPQQGAPLFSEDYLAERELNRTGQLPTDVKKNSHRCNSSKSKKHRHDPSQHDQQLKMEHDSKHAVLPVSHAASTRATAKDQRPAGAMLELAPAGAVPSVDHSVLVVSTSSNITTDNGYAPSSSDTNITHGSDQGRGYPVPASSASAAAVGGGAVGGGTGSDAGSGGLALPFKPLSVSFNNISYFVDLPAGAEGGVVPAGGGKPQLQLLHDITGSFRPGVLTAFMGVSGAGKTTLMDVLAGRKTAGTITGDVWVGGYPKDQHTFARVCGYVEQTDIHSPRTTVREALQYSAVLRLYGTRDKARIEAFVDEVMGLVELTPNRDALVGMPGEWGLSIEQRKRLTIGVELVANPSIVFMDEPTSGLDARAAAIVMRAVRNTVNTGRTVVCTIHQPSISIFDAFDELLLLKRGGRTIYHGALGQHSQQLIQYFTAVQGVDAPSGCLNPATWMLDITAVGSEANLDVDFADVYQDSQLNRQNANLVQELSNPPAGSTPLHFKHPFAASGWTQFSVLMTRWFKSYWRNPAYNATRFAFCIVLGALLGTIYLWLGSKRTSYNDVQNVMGALFICITFLGTSNSNGVQPVVAVERPVYYRELAAGAYTPVPFAIAQILVEIPYVLVQTVLYSVITYFLIGFDYNAAKFFWYFLFTGLTLLFFTYYGMISVAISPDIQLAAIMSSSIYSVWFIFAGFFIPYAAMPVWWSWFYWLNPLSYMLYGIITSQLGDDQHVVQVQPGQMSTVQELLKSSLGFETWFVRWCGLIEAAFIIAMMVAIVAALKFLSFQRR